MRKFVALGAVLLAVLAAAVIDAQLLSGAQETLDRASWDLKRIEMETKLRVATDLARQRLIVEDLNRHLLMGRRHGWHVPGPFAYAENPYAVEGGRERWLADRIAIEARRAAETNAERRQAIQDELDRHNFWGRSQRFHSEGDFGVNPFGEEEFVRWTIKRLELEQILREEANVERRRVITEEYNRLLHWGRERRWYATSK